MHIQRVGAGRGLVNRFYRKNILSKSFLHLISKKHGYYKINLIRNKVINNFEKKIRAAADVEKVRKSSEINSIRNKLRQFRTRFNFLKVALFMQCRAELCFLQ